METKAYPFRPSDTELRDVFHELGQLFTSIIQVIEHVQSEEPSHALITEIAHQLNPRVQAMIPQFQGVAYRLR